MEFKSPVDGLKIDFSVYKSEKEKIRMLFLTGRAEYYRKYEFLFKMLNDNGVSVFAMDHRGQGHSGRMLDDKQVGHVEKFSHFVDDAEFFLNTYILTENDENVQVVSLSHSMGGAISLLLGLRDDYFDKMIFSSPMWGINTGWIGRKSAFLLSKVFCFIGKANDYVIGSGPDDLSGVFEKNRLTHSRGNFKAQKEYLRVNPEAVLGGPSNRWLYESLKMCNELKSADLSVLKSEILLLQAQEEMVVDNYAQDKIVKRISSSKKVEVEEAFHEILFETDSILKKVFSDIHYFLKK